MRWKNRVIFQKTPSWKMQYVVSAGCAVCALQPARRCILRELSTPVGAMSVSSFSQGWCTGSPVIVPGTENMFHRISKPEGDWSERLPGGSNRFAPRKADQLGSNGIIDSCRRVGRRRCNLRPSQTEYLTPKCSLSSRNKPHCRRGIRPSCAAQDLEIIAWCRFESGVGTRSDMHSLHARRLQS